MLPGIVDKAKAAGKAVFESVSHDRLKRLDLASVCWLFDGPAPMVKITWHAQWKDGLRDDFVIMYEYAYAEKHLEKLGHNMEHRLMRDVFMEDYEISVTDIENLRQQR